MKKALALLFLALFFVIPSYSFAQNGTGTSTPRGATVRQEVKERTEERRTERTQALSEARQERIRNYFNRMMKRFEAAIERLERLIERIQSRIDAIKVEDPSENLSEQQNQLDDAGDKLTDAKTRMQNLKDDLEDVIGAQSPKEAFKEVAEDIRSLKQDLIDIHTSLVHIIGDIRGLRVGLGSPRPNASPTATP